MVKSISAGAAVKEVRQKKSRSAKRRDEVTPVIVLVMRGVFFFLDLVGR
jgi:hypothetical protein